MAVDPILFWSSSFWNGNLNTVNNIEASALGIMRATQSAAQDQAMLARALTGLQDRGNRLSEAGKPLTYSNPDNVFTKRTAASTQPEAVTAKAAPNATPASYRITVEQTAEAQENRGTELDSDATSSVTAGTNTFRLAVGGRTHDIAVEIEDTDTNRAVLEKMAAAINAAGAGVTAAVEDDDAAGASRIRLTAGITGSTGAFTLADTGGNAVAATGAGAVETEAADAEYTIDGEEYTAQTNTVSLDQGRVTVGLLKPGSGEVTVTVGHDTGAVTGAVNDLVDSYNAFKSHLAKNEGLLSPYIGQRLARAYDVKEPELNAVGISVNPDGTLAVDQGKLAAAASNNVDSVKNAFGGGNGFAVNAGLVGREIATSPGWSFAAPETHRVSLFTGIDAYMLTLNQSHLGVFSLHGTLLDLMV